MFDPISEEAIQALIEKGKIFHCAGGLMVEHPLMQQLVAQQLITHSSACHVVVRATKQQSWQSTGDAAAQAAPGGICKHQLARTGRGLAASEAGGHTRKPEAGQSAGLGPAFAFSGPG